MDDSAARRTSERMEISAAAYGRGQPVLRLAGARGGGHRGSRVADQAGAAGACPSRSTRTSLAPGVDRRVYGVARRRHLRRGHCGGSQGLPLLLRSRVPCRPRLSRGDSRPFVEPHFPDAPEDARCEGVVRDGALSRWTASAVGPEGPTATRSLRGSALAPRGAAVHLP